VRTPNLCLPMQQQDLTKEEQERRKHGEYQKFFEYRLNTFAGFGYDYVQKNTLDDTPEEREAFYEKMFEAGGFEFWLANYKDLLFDNAANREAYNFWAKKTRARITDPEKREILAPLEPPHAFGTKRPSLEQNYYEMLDKPENKVISVKDNPIVKIVENGIVTADGKVHECDVIALATGFDSVTGGMKVSYPFGLFVRPRLTSCRTWG
jgi:cation diffusion facilitator CzcD-associated flavoprotein CzcO